MATRSKKVRAAQTNESWTVAEAHTGDDDALCRWRTPVLGPPDVEGYEQVLKVVWIYGEVGSGKMPSKEEGKQMAVFEDRLCKAWEHDGLAYLAAVLTYDGARQWVFYTSDVPQCGQRLNTMPQEKKPYPLELNTEPDAEWSWLREILKQFPWKVEK